LRKLNDIYIYIITTNKIKTHDIKVVFIMTQNKGVTNVTTKNKGG